MNGRIWMCIGSMMLAIATGCAPRTPPPPTAEQASTLLADANATMLRLGTESNQADWVYSTYITPDTEILNARAERAYIEAIARYAAEAAKFDNVVLPADLRRQLDLLKLSLEMVTPADPAQAAELTRLSSSLEATYGRGKWCKDAARPATCLDIEQITALLATSRNEPALREAWEGWHAVSPIPVRCGA
jgi:peptidyl-dipeptidase A